MKQCSIFFATTLWYRKTLMEVWTSPLANLLLLLKLIRLSQLIQAHRWVQNRQNCKQSPLWRSKRSQLSNNNNNSQQYKKRWHNHGSERYPMRLVEILRAAILLLTVRMQRRWCNQSIVIIIRLRNNMLLNQSMMIGTLKMTWIMWATLKCHKEESRDLALISLLLPHMGKDQPQQFLGQRTEVHKINKENLLLMLGPPKDNLKLLLLYFLKPNSLLLHLGKELFQSKQRPRK